MLVKDSILYVYPITRDLGFAPNPFHGVCTLATCKPKIRKKAKVNDWVMGLAGAKIRDKKHHCVYLMCVSEILSFDEYWRDPRFQLKVPVRNGSKVQVLGDNIYHKDPLGCWVQENSHHSNADGSLHEGNLKTDTGSTENVLISHQFKYFGKAAIPIDLIKLQYGKIRDYRMIHLKNNEYAKTLITELLRKSDEHNTV